MKKVALAMALSALAWTAAAQPQPAPEDTEHGSVKCLKAAQSIPDLAHENRAWVLCKDAEDAQPVACYAAASAMQDDPIAKLTDGYSQAAFDFCRDSGSLGRLKCYMAARQTGLEFDEETARLFCRRASDTKPVACYRLAVEHHISHERGASLSGYSPAFEFCRYGGSAERVRCYASAQENHLPDDIAYNLCRSASDVRPVQCYLGAVQIHGSADKAVDFCTKKGQ
ncbi:MAG: hypothetical protein NTY77_18205 [Elusimicrobia bacterium]|nr:hypothetical protein [Elusimicrobiota bacterium]